MSSDPEPVILSIEVLLQMYLDTLDEKEKMAYNIAKTHLGSSFSLEKSNGFVEWRKKNYGDKK